MLKTHMNAIEAVLIAQSRTASIAGHPNLRGGPREWFIREFLDSHLPGTLETGQGEVIDCNSVPRPPPKRYRPQNDIVLYRKDLPKISLAKNFSAFFAEGVMATIEVKSKLTKAGVRRACEVSRNHKQLHRETPTMGMGSGCQPESIVSYLVAFDGPKKLRTVTEWLLGVALELSMEKSELPDIVVVLGKGSVWRLDAFPGLAFKKSDVPTKNKTWAYAEQVDQNLFTLFAHMLSWMGWATPPPAMRGYWATLTHSVALA